jgi:hypothetical protein
LLRVTPDGTVVVVRGKRLSFFKDNGAPEVLELAGIPSDGVTSLGVSPDGRRLVLAAGSWPSSVVQLWDLPARKRLASFRPPAASHLGSVAVRGPVIALAVDHRVCLLNAHTGQIQQTFPAPPQPPQQARERSTSWFPGVQALSFSPQGDLLASGRAAGAVELLEVSSGKSRRVLVPALARHTACELRNVVFSPCGNMVAAESSDGIVEVWETSSGKLRRRFLGHRSYQTALAFSPDGMRIATGNRDGTILVWDVFGAWTAAAASARPSAAELTALWARLKDGDAERASLAMGRLLRYPEVSVPFLRRSLLSRKGPGAARVRQWIAELDSDEFHKRQQASRELARRLPGVGPALEAALAGKPSLEVRRRLERLLRQAKSGPLSPETLRDLRGLEVLEHMASPDATDALKELARDEDHPWLKARALAASNRLSARPPGASR